MKLVHGVEKLPGPGSIPMCFILDALGQDHPPGQAAPPNPKACSKHAFKWVWGRVSVASLTLAYAMRGDRDSNPGPSGHRR